MRRCIEGWRIAPAGGDVLCVGLLAEDAAARAKVRELEVVVHDENVLGFDVPVEDAVAVHVVHRLRRPCVMLESFVGWCAWLQGQSEHTRRQACGWLCWHTQGCTQVQGQCMVWCCCGQVFGVLLAMRHRLVRRACKSAQK